MSGVDPINYDVGELRALADDETTDDRGDRESHEGPDPQSVTEESINATVDDVTPVDPDRVEEPTQVRSLDEWEWGLATDGDSKGPARTGSGDHTSPPPSNTSAEPGSTDRSADDREAREPTPEMVEWEPGSAVPDKRRVDSPDHHGSRTSDAGQTDPSTSTSTTTETGTGPGPGPGSGSGPPDSGSRPDTASILRDVQERLKRLREGREDGSGMDTDPPRSTDHSGGGSDTDPATAGRGQPDETRGTGGQGQEFPVDGRESDAGPADATVSHPRSLPAEPRPDDHRVDRNSATSPDNAEYRSPRLAATGDEDGSSLSDAVAAALDEDTLAEGSTFDISTMSLGEKPYLTYIPDQGEPLVRQWIEFLLTGGGSSGAIAAIDAYRETGWITVGVTVDLKSRVERRPSVPGEFGDLDRSDHLRSLHYINKIANK